MLVQKVADEHAYKAASRNGKCELHEGLGFDEIAESSFGLLSVRHIRFIIAHRGAGAIHLGLTERIRGIARV